MGGRADGTGGRTGGRADGRADHEFPVQDLSPVKKCLQVSTGFLAFPFISGLAPPKRTSPPLNISRVGHDTCSMAMLPWKCVLFSKLKNSRPWKSRVFSEPNAQAPGSVYSLRN